MASSQGRQEWVRADLRCMLCGRTLGTLLGSAAQAREHRGLARFATFRSSVGEIVRLIGSENLRCTACGGTALVGEMERFCTDAPIVEPEPAPGTPRCCGCWLVVWRQPQDPRLRLFGLTAM